MTDRDTRDGMTTERIRELRALLGPNRPGRICAVERAIGHECLNEIERLSAGLVVPSGLTAEKLRAISWVLNGHIGQMGGTEASRLLVAWADALSTQETR